MQTRVVDQGCCHERQELDAPGKGHLKIDQSHRGAVAA